MNPLLDWLGSGGKPVEQATANYRALICQVCEENRARLWWEWAKDVIADCIKARLEVKNSMNLMVPNEEQLHMCRVCGCCNRLKVWTPLEHIKDAERFPDNCWIKRGL